MWRAHAIRVQLTKRSYNIRFEHAAHSNNLFSLENRIEHWKKWIDSKQKNNKKILQSQSELDSLEETIQIDKRIDYWIIARCLLWTWNGKCACLYIFASKNVIDDLTTTDLTLFLVF